MLQNIRSIISMNYGTMAVNYYAIAQRIQDSHIAQEFKLHKEVKIADNNILSTLLTVQKASSAHPHAWLGPRYDHL